jgi:hypothetical protein
MSISLDALLYEAGKVVFTTIVATGISLYAQRIFVERNQKRSQHSKEFAKETLLVLTQRIQEVCQEGCVYDFKSDKLVPKQLYPYTSLPYYDYVKEHFISGYKDEWILWQTIEQKTREYNTKYAELSEKMRQDLFKDIPSLNEKEYYYKVGQLDPATFVKPDSISGTIIEEILCRLKGFREWFPAGKLEEMISDYGGYNIYTLKSINSPYMVHSRSIEDVKQTHAFILKKVTSAELIKEVGTLQTLKEEKENHLTQLSNRVLMMKSSIELGNIIKGKCEVCTHF